jgi:hypothetical protein
MKAAVIASVIVLAGCQGLSLENSIGIDETDNGVLCANVEIRPVWTCVLKDRAAEGAIRYP